MNRLAAVAMILACAAACSGPGGRFVDLWLTPDQQGRLAFEDGDFEQAARRFQDSMWRGTAFYLAQDFEAALAEFARVDTAEGWFNRGNALTHLERYEEARDAYLRALELRPEYPAAEANYAYLEPFLPLEFEGGEMGTVGRDAAADDIVFDAEADRLEQEGTETVLESDQGMISDEQLADIWLRQVDTNPAAFLRYKFRYQAVAGGGAGTETSP